MTSRRDIGQANKRRRLQRVAREIADEDPEFYPHRPTGWRTVWPEEFPVTIRRDDEAAGQGSDRDEAEPGTPLRPCAHVREGRAVLEGTASVTASAQIQPECAQRAREGRGSDEDQ